MVITGDGIGDYPHMPDVPDEQKDNYYPYDIPDLKRNFGEPVISTKISINVYI